jgi:hypothetical protein
MERLRKLSAEALAKQVGDRDRSEITELAFTGVPLPPDAVFNAALFPALTKLTAVGLRPPLASCDAICGFKSLRVLDVSDNRLAGFPAAFAMPDLVDLVAANNAVPDGADALAGLRACPRLQRVDLFMNPAAGKDGYRAAVFALSPSLDVVDDRTRDGEEVEFEADGDDVSDSDDDEEASDDDDDEEEEDEEGENEEGEDEEGDSGVDEPARKQHRTE